MALAPRTVQVSQESRFAVMMESFMERKNRPLTDEKGSELAEGEGDPWAQAQRRGTGMRPRCRGDACDLATPGSLLLGSEGTGLVLFGWNRIVVSELHSPGGGEEGREPLCGGKGD